MTTTASASHAATIPTVEQIDLGAIPYLMEMTRAGILLDPGRLQPLSIELGQIMEHNQGMAWVEVGEIFNLGSPDQIARMLFDKLKLPYSKRTKTGLSTDLDVLGGG